MILRILMFSYYFPPQYSGAAKQALSLAKHLRGRGHHIEFITVKWPGLEERDEVEGFPVRRIEAGRGKKHREFRFWWNFLRYALSRRKDFDVLHSHGAYYTNSIVGPLAKLLGWRSLVKASLANNDLHGLRKSLAGRLHLRFLRMVNAYVAISEELEQEFLSFDLPPERIYHLPNGVDTERFRPPEPEEKKNIRNALGLPEEKKIVLTAGVFDERKNIGWLVKQWVRLNAPDSDALLLAVGPRSREDADGSFVNSLRRLADENATIVRLPGQVGNIEQYYQAADVFVLPSLSEGMPNVVLEAMSSGLPCISTRVSGIQELVQAGITGYTFALDDPRSLERALSRISRENGREMGSRARKLIEKKYSISLISEHYEELYKKLLREGGLARRKMSRLSRRKQTHA
jgi:glycosyltransferase involved in cell wall biosynthesis